MWSYLKPTVKAVSRLLENSGTLIHQTPWCRCWQTPASSHLKAWRQPARLSQVVLIECDGSGRIFTSLFVWHLSLGSLMRYQKTWDVSCFPRRVRGARGQQAEEAMGQRSSREASESVGEGPAEQSLQHLFNKQRWCVDIWIHVV